MSTMKIKKGDTVKVIAGKDKDKEGKVVAVDKKNGKVTVEKSTSLPSTQSLLQQTRMAELSRWKLPLMHLT